MFRVEKRFIINDTIQIKQMACIHSASTPIAQAKNIPFNAMCLQMSIHMYIIQELREKKCTGISCLPCRNMDDKILPKGLSIYAAATAHSQQAHFFPPQSPPQYLYLT